MFLLATSLKAFEAEVIRVFEQVGQEYMISFG